MEATIYTKDNCHHCVRAKALLELNGYNITEIDAIEHKEDLVERVTEKTGRAPNTVPQIWIGEQYIGGASALTNYFKSV